MTNELRAAQLEEMARAREGRVMRMEAEDAPDRLVAEERREAETLRAAAHALRNHDALVAALEAEGACDCNASESKFSAYPCAACRTHRRAALANARKTP